MPEHPLPMHLQKQGKQHQRLSRLIESGKLDEARQLACSLSGKYPRDADIWYTLASLYARQGLIDQVMNCCERVISLSPNHVGAHYNIATASCQTGQVHKAESSFRKCLNLDPMHPAALLGMGRLLSSEQRQTEALTYFKQATSIRPLNADAFYCLGVTQQAQNNPDAAMQAYQQAIRIQPNHVEAINNLGDILSEQGKLSESLTLFTRLIQLKPNLPQAHNNTGVVYESMGKMQAAETAYRKAIALDPSLAEPKTHLGFLLAGEGRTPEALQLFHEVLILAPTHEAAVAGKAVALEQLGQIEAAYTTIEPAISAGSTNPDSVLAYCKIMLRKGDLQTGIRIAEQLLGHAGLPAKGISDLHFSVGDLHDKAGDYPAAFAHYQKANSAAPCTYSHKNHIHYINRIIHSTNKDVLYQLPKAKPIPRQIIFIVGMPRSGTSLIEQILSSHPDVFGAGELRHIGEIANTKYPDAINKLNQTDINSMAQRYIKAIETEADASPLVIDKMPHNFLYLGLISLLLPDAKVIHVSRTPLDNCLSLYFHSFNAMHSYTTDLHLLGQYYCQYQRLMQHWQATLNIPIFNIAYEKIVHNPEHSTCELLGFCNLNWDEACLNFHNSGRFVKTPSYDQVRRPIYSSSVARWKHYQPFIGPLEDALGR